MGSVAVVKDISKGPLELPSPHINEDLPAPNSTQVYDYTRHSLTLCI